MAKQSDPLASQSKSESSKRPNTSRSPDNALSLKPMPTGSESAAPTTDVAGLHSTLGDPRLPAVQRQNMAKQLSSTLGNRHLQRAIAQTVQRREGESTFDVAAAVSYNQSRFPRYNQALVDQLHQVAGDDAAYQAATASGQVGEAFARLVYAAQQAMFPGSASDHDGKLGPGTLRTVRQQAGVASTPAGMAADGVEFSEEQVYSSNYERFNSDRGGDFTVTGGFMEPHGHSQKGTTHAIFSDNPDQARELPPSGRNLGVDYVVHDQGKPANVWYGGLVIHAGLDGGYGHRVIVETDVTYMYQGREYAVTQAYGHLARIDAQVGQIVNAGESVGQMGGTGSGGVTRYPEHIDLRTWITVGGQRIDVSPNVLDSQLTRRAAETGAETAPQPQPPGTNPAPAPTPEPGQLGSSLFQGDSTLAAVLNGEQYLRHGSKGDSVTRLQQGLTNLGFSTQGVDGDFGDNTERAVRAYQEANNLQPVDGVVGPTTIRALDQSLGGAAPSTEAPATESPAPGNEAPTTESPAPGNEAPTTETPAPGNQTPAPGNETPALPPMPPLVQEMLKFVPHYEGRHATTYLDSKGIPTVGIGFNLQRPNAAERMAAVGANYQRVLAGQDALTDAQIDALFVHDMNYFTEQARGVVSNFDSLPKIAQMILADMCFNMGPNRLGGFVKAIAAFERYDYATAADEMQDSQWYREVGDRSEHHVQAIRYLASTDTAEEAQTTQAFDVAGATAFNQRQGLSYDQSTVDRMYQITGNEHLYRAATEAGDIGDAFSRLVYATQLTMLRTVAQADGKFGTGTQGALRNWAADLPEIPAGSGPGPAPSTETPAPSTETPQPAPETQQPAPGSQTPQPAPVTETPQPAPGGAVTTLDGTRFAGNADLAAVLRGEKALRFGDKSDAVKLVQEALLASGLTLSGSSADGDYGARTVRGVVFFQRAMGLSPDDGIIGKDTLAALTSFPYGSRSLASMEEVTEEEGPLVQSAQPFTSPVVSGGNQLRSDSAGGGHFHASRGNRLHYGVDLVAPPGAPVLAPFSGYMVAHAPPGSQGMDGILIQGTGKWANYRVKMFYMRPALSPNQRFDEGTPIGAMQNLLDSSSYNNPAMTNHVHVEVYLNGTQQDPTPYLL